MGFIYNMGNRKAKSNTRYDDFFEGTSIFWLAKPGSSGTISIFRAYVAYFRNMYRR